MCSPFDVQPTTPALRVNPKVLKKRRGGVACLHVCKCVQYIVTWFSGTNMLPAENDEKQIVCIYGRLCPCVTGREKPEIHSSMEGRLGLLLSLVMAACFYGSAAQRTGGYDLCSYDLTSCIPAQKGSRRTCPCYNITSSYNICETNL